MRYNPVARESLERQQKNLAEIYSSIRMYPFASVIEDWQRMVDEWLSVRDVESFLKKVTADKKRSQEPDGPL